MQRCIGGNGIIIEGNITKNLWKNVEKMQKNNLNMLCLLYTSDAADERSSVDLGGRRIIKKKKKEQQIVIRHMKDKT